MPYVYEEIRPRLFTEEDQKTFLKIRDRAKALLVEAGAFRLEECALIHNAGDSWTLMACVDRLVELGEIREIPTNGMGQHRIFTAP